MIPLPLAVPIESKNQLPVSSQRDGVCMCVNDRERKLEREERPQSHRECMRHGNTLCGECAAKICMSYSSDNAGTFTSILMDKLIL